MANGFESIRVKRLIDMYRGNPMLFTDEQLDELEEIASTYNAIRIHRPPELSKSETLTEDVLIHALKCMRDQHKINPEIIVCEMPVLKINIDNKIYFFIVYKLSIY